MASEIFVFACIQHIQSLTPSLDAPWLPLTDRETGLLYLDPKYVPLLQDLEWESQLMRELGPDFSGPNIANCSCPQCQCKTDLDDTRKSKIRAAQIVAEVTAKRRG